MIESKLFVACKKEDVINIGNSVTEALNKYTRSKLDSYWMDNTDAINRAHFLSGKDYKDASKLFTNGVSISSYNFDSFVFILGNGDKNKRILHMFPTCGSDYSGIYEGYKVIFSIGRWGSCDELMMVVADAVKKYGDVYYDYNDCDDLGFIKLA